MFSAESVVEVKILIHEIVKVLIHFGRGMPVLFFYTTASAAAKIRGILKMTSTDGFYYDPRATTGTWMIVIFMFVYWRMSCVT